MANNSVIFGVVAVAVLALGLWTLRRVVQACARNKPKVLVTAAVAQGRRMDLADYIAVSIVNPSRRAVRVGKFLLRLNQGGTLYIPLDDLTKEPQYERPVEPGGRASFHINIERIRKGRLKPGDFRCAVVEAAGGGEYRSGTSELQAVIGRLLEPPKR